MPVKNSVEYDGGAAGTIGGTSATTTSNLYINKTSSTARFIEMNNETKKTIPFIKQ